MSINLNSAPYFDDYDEEKLFTKILFRPGYAVQTRELNQLQSLYQKQVERLGQHFFKEGAMVIPGGLVLNTNYNYVILSGTVNSVITTDGVDGTSTLVTDLETAFSQMIGSTAIAANGTTALVKNYQLATNTSALTIFVEYDSSGGVNANVKSFLANQVLEVKVPGIDEDNYTTYTLTTVSSNATGVGSAVEIDRGVYFINGTFVLVNKQTLILDAYSNTPTYSVGLSVVDTVVTPEEDSSLYDNANGSFNFTAPGAHRYKTQPVLTKQTIGGITNANYVELLQVKNGSIESHVTTTEYSELAKELARRTYDESGDYTVSPFTMRAKESRNNDRGAWATSTQYLIGDVVTSNSNTYVAVSAGTSGGTAPSHDIEDGEQSDGGVFWINVDNPYYNNGHTLTGNEDDFVLSIEAGKAYVRGYEINKVATSFITIDKARDTKEIRNDLVPTTIGNYVMIKGGTEIGIPNVTDFVKVNLLNSQDATVGTAFIRGIEKDGADYRLYLFAISLNDGITINREIKRISSIDTSFSASVLNAVTTDARGNLSTSSTAVTGVGTLFTEDFVVNDYIEINGQYRRITAIASNTALTISSALSSNVTNVAYRIHRARVFDATRTRAVFPLDKPYIYTITGISGGTDVTYTVVEKKTATSTSGVATVTTSVGRIDPNVEASEIIVTSSGNAFASFTLPTVPTSNNDQTLTINGLSDGTYTIFFPVRKVSDISDSFGAPKNKDLQTFASIDYTTTAAIQERSISLQKADVLRVRKILMATTTGAFNATGAIDITDHFDLDNGQRDAYYDVGRIVRKPGYPPPSGSLRIYFDYFTHDGVGAYFCVDSYGDVTRNEIPYYKELSLADCLDFRPRISDDGTSFTGTGAILTYPPKPGTSSEFSYDYYLPRIDKVSLNIEGKFIHSKGISADVPGIPETPVEAMHMATLYIAPYTALPSTVNIEKVDNRRYTMRDIGKLERRIENLEYYTTLSLLEQQASTLDVKDEFGLDRFKNGFIVDNFAGHTTGNVGSSDYRASIDMDAKELRPMHHMDNVKLIEANNTRSTYSIKNDIVTLPYTEQVGFIAQTTASTPQNVNPFAVFTFLGAMEINPPSDEWIETTRIPEIINDVEGNFSAVLTAEREAGTLGTVWNAWETQWTGTQVVGTRTEVNTDINSMIWQLFTGFQRETTFEVIATQSGQTRTGINTEVRATLSKEFVNDRVVSRSVIPFIRSRNMVFVASAMKPSSLVYPFFDDVDVSSYVTPAARISYTGTQSALEDNFFDYETNAGIDSEQAARNFDDRFQASYGKGDVIYVSQRGATSYTVTTAPATAVCVFQEVGPNSELSVLVLNTNGTFQAGDVITGTISGVTGTVTAYAQPTSLITNATGNVAGVFNIPNTDSLRFATGNREFKLIDDSSNNDAIATTRSFANYRAEGTLQTWQATFNSVRNAEVVRTTVTDNRTILSDERLGRVIADNGWLDPLAQTFLIENSGGAFITSVDIWFATVDLNKPITLQIREVVNGYPGKNILPFSTVTLYPHELNLASEKIVVDGIECYRPTAATRFNMKAPVYVQDIGEYCIVLLSDSTNYNVWTSKLGATDVQTENIISEQPYAGVLFKSQNASTWTAEQNQDLMFRINVANFSSSGSVDFVNAGIDSALLRNNPIFIRTSSKLARVYHANHGLSVGDSVTLSGTTPNIDGSYTILHVQEDAFVIRLASAQTSTGRIGGSAVKCTRNVKCDVVQPIVQQLNFPDTSIAFKVATVASPTTNNYFSVNANENNYFDLTRTIKASEKNFHLKADMSTSNTYVSPVIDTARLSVITVKNRINDPDLQVLNYDGETESGGAGDGEFDLYTLFTGTVNFSGNTVQPTDSANQNIFISLKVGKYIVISDAANAGNNGIHLITDIASNGTITTATAFTTASADSVTVKLYDNFVDETASESSALAKYVTRKINLSGSAASSNNLTIRFSADIPSGSEIGVYYKAVQSSTETSFENINWVFVDNVTSVVSLTNNASTSINKGMSGFTDVSFNIPVEESFNAAAVKLVLKSTNSAKVPRAKNLIIVATS